MFCKKYFQEKKRLLEEEELLHYFSQLISALSYLHSQNVVHLDIRPESIKLDSLINLKLDNFSLALQLESIEDNFVNTNDTSIFFAAPEIFKSSKVTYKVDVWAMGVLFYYMASYRLPFTGENETEIKENINSDVPLNIPL